MHNFIAQCSEQAVWPYSAALEQMFPAISRVVNMIALEVQIGPLPPAWQLWVSEGLPLIHQVVPAQGR